MKKFLLKNYKLLFSFFLLLGFTFLLNFLTPYAADDYSYMYNLSDGNRINSISQIFSSLAYHYTETGNGRVVSHFFVMLFLIFSKWIFNITNSVFFILLIYGVYNLTSQKSPFSFTLFFTIPALFWIYMPAYGQVFLWLDGSINYMWSYCFSIIFLSVYINLLRHKTLLDASWKLILFCIFTLLFGNYSENVSFPVISMGFLLLCITIYQNHNFQRYITYFIPIISGALGYLVLLLSPAGSAKFSENLSFSFIIKNGITIFTTYYSLCKIPLIIFFILLGIAVHYKLNNTEILIALSYFFISFIAAAMLIIASYLPERSLANSIIFLLFAIIQLLQLLRSNLRLECITLCICIYLIVGNLMSYWNGSYDIYRVHQEQTARDNLIDTTLTNGQTSLGVPIITSTTKYSCKYGLLDLNSNNSSDPFPNVYVAKYYGLNEIYVIYPDSSN